MEIRSESPAGPLLAVHPLTMTPPRTPTHARKVCCVECDRRRSPFDELVSGFTDWLSTRALPPPTTHPSPVTHVHNNLSTIPVTDHTAARRSEFSNENGALKVVFSAWRLVVYLSGLEQLLEEHVTQRRSALLRGTWLLYLFDLRRHLIFPKYCTRILIWCYNCGHYKRGRPNRGCHLKSNTIILCALCLHSQDCLVSGNKGPVSPVERDYC